MRQILGSTKDSAARGETRLTSSSRSLKIRSRLRRSTGEPPPPPSPRRANGFCSIALDGTGRLNGVVLTFVQRLPFIHSTRTQVCQAPASETRRVPRKCLDSATRKWWDEKRGKKRGSEQVFVLVRVPNYRRGTPKKSCQSIHFILPKLIGKVFQHEVKHVSLACS